MNATEILHCIEVPGRVFFQRLDDLFGAIVSSTNLRVFQDPTEFSCKNCKHGQVIYIKYILT